MLVLLLMLADEPSALIARVRALTAVERRCPVDRNSTDVTVCGRRNADRFRVPLLPDRDSTVNNAAAERTALLHRTNPIQDLSPFLVGGGFAGVTATVGSGKTSVGGARPMAP